mmetsp:Transcript_13682/g.38865  ORF Transcript_13682/g.38865 Transcript_13682/m.38865 type:complete len:212 (+) Transcript_13682:70-705(+)
MMCGRRPRAPFLALSLAGSVSALLLPATELVADDPPGPAAKDEAVEGGWRKDGFLGMGRTPKAAKAALQHEVDVEIAPTDELFNKNKFMPYYGRKMILESLTSTDTCPRPFFGIMKALECASNLRGKKISFTFGPGNYIEENVLGTFPYAIGGFLSENEAVTYSIGNGFSRRYGYAKLEDESSDDRMVVTGFSPGLLGRGHFKCILVALDE